MSDFTIYPYKPEGIRYLCPWCSYTTISGIIMEEHYKTHHACELGELKKEMNKSTERVAELITETKKSIEAFMTYEKFDELFDSLITQCRSMKDTKGREYAGLGNRLDNFNRQGRRNDIDPLKVCNIYLGKHIDAIDNFVREGRVFSESIESRIVDAITYLTLMMGIIKSRESMDKTK